MKYTYLAVFAFSALLACAQTGAQNSELQRLKKELKGYQLKYAGIDSTISAKQQEMEQQKKQIESLYKRGVANEKILTDIRGVMSRYEQSITELQKKIKELSDQNQALSEENEKLKKNK